MMDVSEFERWFNQAVHTYDSAKRDHEDTDFDWACFKCQQAAEFALKAFLRGVGKLGIGHSLMKLTKEIEALDIDVDEIRKCALTLEKFYIPRGTRMFMLREVLMSFMMLKKLKKLWIAV